MLLLLVVAGVYRTARMLAQEDGPADAFSRLRAAVDQSTWVGRGLACIFCVSFWIAGIAVALLIVQGYAAWRDLWYLWPGIAGLAAIVYQVVR
jgi:hypothetical protein